jgi:hypothetical protein
VKPSRKSLESWISVACGGLTVDSPNLAGPGFAACRPANTKTPETSKHSWHFPESFEADFFDNDESLIAKCCGVFAQSDNVDECRYFWILIFISDFIPSFQLLEHGHMVESGW